MNKSKCVFKNCEKEFDFTKVKIKKATLQNGIMRYWFDCPNCGKETCNLESYVDLTGRKVKIFYQRLIPHKSQFSPKYIKYIEDNRGIVFTAVAEKKDIYTFKEDDTFAFEKNDIYIVE